MAKVLMEKLNKHFGEVKAVRDFDLEIPDKEFVVLVGPSGCGKTTTLRMVAGLEDITSGDILIDDKVVNNLPPKDRDIAMVFQNYALYPHMTVYQNMAFGLTLRKFPKEEIDQRVKDAAEILNIKELLDRKPKALSGGQRQRVAVGRAIVRKPKVFLFDEPLSNLDAKLRVQMRVELKKLHERLQTTIIYVTHDQVEAMTMGDRIVVMKDGLKQQVGPPLELYFHPANKFVAGFIGSPAMNFIEGELFSEGGAVHFQGPGMKLKIPGDKASKVKGYSEKRVIFGVRPEDLPEAPCAAPGETFDVTVEVMEPLGSEVYLDVKAAEQSLIARAEPNTTAKPHARLCLQPNMENIHLFDIRDEKTLV
ncbi:MAG TPA: sn-glycerol-3-phosphate ABC transporter ATP-binding protein UgpC [Thermodesulfobacteriota bacterium]|nr:sn-glycerol-3-phosphate ABC transporter ATP-binding protein UgpC [Thermodesulfobacteriota bacterium]